MSKVFYIQVGSIVSVVLVVVGWSLLRPDRFWTVQRGYSGTGMELVLNGEALEEAADSTTRIPEILLPSVSEEDADGPFSYEVYQNVQVLGNLPVLQFNRLMTAMVAWVAPGEQEEGQGCAYCHNVNNMASDEKYPKHIARRMIQMTQHINEKWQTHVSPAGVNCYTCHRGMNVPKYVWYTQPEHPMKYRGAGNPGGQNIAAASVGLASLPGDVFTPFLLEDNNIRVVGPTALPTTNRQSIKQAEWTYGLMMHMTNALGVNCTYCHNSRSVAVWEQSPPARSTAWYGIRMVRSINTTYTAELVDRYPPHRLGPTGDAPKANCFTCHQGAYKPLLGTNMIESFPSLSRSDYYASAVTRYQERQAAEERAAAEAAAAETEAGDGTEAGSDAGATDGAAPAEPAEEIDEGPQGENIP
jgi:photosynthetic reaction center cytochrome c subunit